MKFEEFKNEVIRLLRLRIHDEKYIKDLDKDIKEYFDDTESTKEITGTGADVDDYILGILFLYPELPY